MDELKEFLSSRQIYWECSINNQIRFREALITYPKWRTFIAYGIRISVYRDNWSWTYTSPDFTLHKLLAVSFIGKPLA